MTQPASPISVRRIDLKPTATTEEYWFEEYPFETHFFNALSSTFPEGERFFIRAVRAYTEQLRDTELGAQVVAFVGQEGQHSREHEAHVQLLLDQGYVGIERMNRVMGTVMGWFLRYVPRYSLAVTCAIEHITATLARTLITEEARYLDPMAAEMRFFWHWHASEELEHKAVAFDVYQQTGGDYPMRVVAMVQVATGLFVEIFVRHCYLLWKDGAIADPDEWQRGTPFLLGREGLLRKLWRGMGAYLRRDFHPDSVHEDRTLITDFEHRYGEHYS